MRFSIGLVLFGLLVAALSLQIVDTIDKRAGTVYLILLLGSFVLANQFGLGRFASSVQKITRGS